jgi:hypothetical protein
MKKSPTILIAAVIAACVTSVFAQGTVVFNNGTGLVLQQKSGSDPTLIPVPKGGGAVQLYWAPTGTPYTHFLYSMTAAAWYNSNPGWTLGPVVGFTTPTAGKFNGGALTLSPLTPGGSIDYVVMGWIGIAESFDAALAANTYVDVSSRFTSATGNPTTVPPGTAVPLADTFGGLNLVPVPEPSSLSMALLGAATLFILRRRA